jgi:hypothetical protein
MSADEYFLNQQGKDAIDEWLAEIDAPHSVEYYALAEVIMSEGGTVLTVPNNPTPLALDLDWFWWIE